MKKGQREYTRIREIIQRIPFNRKLTLGMIAVLIMPIAIILLLVFNQIEDYQIGQVGVVSKSELERTEIFVDRNVDAANTIIQTIKANNQITDYVSRTVSADELINFNRQTTSYIESIVITNPYIRGIRIYCNSQRLPEQWPVFISNDRVKDEEWFENADKDYISMRIDYSENLSKHTQQLSGNNLISFSSGLNTENGEDKAVIEVSYYMKDFFGESYTGLGDNFCFLYRDNNIYADISVESGKERILVAKDIVDKVGYGNSDYVVEVIDGKQYLVSSVESRKLNGDLIMVTDLSNVLWQISQSRILLIVVITALIILLALIYNAITKVLLGRIYQTINAMRSLEQGDRVKIDNVSQDEIGQLQNYFNKMLDRIDYLIDQNSKRELLEKDAQIKALQNQINSHFLYNVLNNIAMMAIVDGNKLIEDTVTALGRLLRYSMNWKSQLVPLSGEISYVEDYVQLFNIRFDNEIILVCKIEPELENILIPKMSIQPVVENAIVHGIEKTAKDAAIRISAHRENEIVVIEITDSGSGMDKDTLEALNNSLQGKEGEKNLTGIGLKNVQERIERHFGDAYGIYVNSKLGAYTKVTIKIPFRKQ